MTPTERREQEQRDRVRAALARTDSSEGLVARLRTMADLGAAGRGPAWFRKASPTASEAADRIEALEGRDAHLYADTVDRLLAESQRQLAVAQAQIEALEGERDKFAVALAESVELAQPALAAGLAEAQRKIAGYQHHLRECEQFAGRALGYPWFKDDQVNFPGAAEADRVCVGEHIGDTIVEELANAFTALEARLSALDPGGLGSSLGGDQGRSQSQPGYDDSASRDASGGNDCYVHPFKEPIDSADFCPTSDVRIYTKNAERIASWNRRAPAASPVNAYDRLLAEYDRLHHAAQAVVIRWDTPLWKNVEPTATVIGELRSALGSDPASPAEPSAVWKLGARDSEAFVQALADPPSPNDAALAAAARYRARDGMTVADLRDLLDGQPDDARVLVFDNLVQRLGVTIGANCILSMDHNGPVAIICNQDEGQ